MKSTLYDARGKELVHLVEDDIPNDAPPPAVIVLFDSGLTFQLVGWSLGGGAVYTQTPLGGTYSAAVVAPKMRRRGKCKPSVIPDTLRAMVEDGR